MTSGTNLGRSRWQIRAESLWRIATMQLPPGIQGQKVLVNEYPKSGGTWLGGMLSAALGLPFPRHQFPPLSPCIMHGHYVRRFRNPALVLLWRDPRDLIVSWYHHCVFGSEQTHTEFVAGERDSLGFSDFDDIRRNLPAFIDYAFTRQRTPRFSWSDFFDRWANCTDAVHVRYEDLRADTSRELERVCAELGLKIDSSRAREIAEEHSFERKTGRKAGEERRGSFLRKGVVGDWSASFSREAGEALACHIGERIVSAGYAESVDWYRQID